MYRKDKIKVSVLALSCACLFQVSDAVPDPNTVYGQDPEIHQLLAGFGQSTEYTTKSGTPPRAKMDPVTGNIVQSALVPHVDTVNGPFHPADPSTGYRTILPTPVNIAQNTPPANPSTPPRPATDRELDAEIRAFQTYLDDLKRDVNTSGGCVVYDRADENMMRCFAAEDGLRSAIERCKNALHDKVLLSSAEVLRINSKINQIECEIIDIEENDEMTQSDKAKHIMALKTKQANWAKKKTADYSVARLAKLKSEFKNEIELYLSAICDRELEDIVLETGLLNGLLNKVRSQPVPVASAGAIRMIRMLGGVNNSLSRLGATKTSELITAKLRAKMAEIDEIEHRNVWAQLGSLGLYSVSAALTAIRTMKNIGNEENSKKTSKKLINWMAAKIVERLPNGAARTTGKAIAQIIYHVPVGLCVLATIPLLGAPIAIASLGAVLTSDLTAPFFHKCAKQVDPIHPAARMIQAAVDVRP